MALIKETTGVFLPDKNGFYVNIPPDDITEIVKAVFFRGVNPEQRKNKIKENNSEQGRRY